MTLQPANLISINITDPETGLVPQSIPVTGQLTPPQIATAYHIPAATGYGINIGIFSFGGGFLQSDLNKSWADLQAAGLLPSTYTVPTIKQVLLDTQTGTFSSTDNASGENTVDIFCAATMAPQANITIYIGDLFQSLVTQAIADGMHIITCSWGGTEYTSDEPYFQQLAEAKITFLVASGDNGSVAYSGYTSESVVYPASSPWAISVGGTKLTLNVDNTRATETDDNRDSSFGSSWGGGGGISTTFSLPSWQTGLTYTPITGGVKGSPTPLTMRGSPDISSPMNVYGLYFNGVVSGYGGTSLASPTMAGILARLRQLSGKAYSSPDWNTIAYANTGSFYDITVGTNNDSISNGYAGTIGWDCVTGLGPPTGSLMYKLIRTGDVFPKGNYGFRSTGVAYPRTTTNITRPTSTGIGTSYTPAQYGVDGTHPSPVFYTSGVPAPYNTLIAFTNPPAPFLTVLQNLTSGQTISWVQSTDGIRYTWTVTGPATYVLIPGAFYAWSVPTTGIITPAGTVNSGIDGTSNLIIT